MIACFAIRSGRSILSVLLILCLGCERQSEEQTDSFLHSGYPISNEDKVVVTLLSHEENRSLTRVIDSLSLSHEIDKKIPAARIAPYQNYWTPLCFAAYSGNSKAIASLLKKKANVHYKDGNGDTPLLLAAMNGNPESISELLKNGATINERDSTGIDALACAAVTGKINNIKQLISKGCELNHEDGSLNALDYAVFYNQTAVADYLKSKGMKPTNTLDKVLPKP